MPSVKVGVGVDRLRAYITHVSWSNFLFFGRYSDISAAKMPNLLGSDWLTVGGIVGSETYQCPDTAAYKAADTDNIWFKLDTTRRMVTKTELIGYDLQKTPVRYNNDSPNDIVYLGIIKYGAVISAAQRDIIFTYFGLPLMWDDMWNDNGSLKGNRGFEQQLFTPE